MLTSSYFYQILGKAHIFPNFSAGALISVGIMCDHGCTSHLDKNKTTICRNGAIILHGHRHHTNGRWTIYYTYIIPYKTSTSHPLQYSTMVQCISFLHGSLGFPSLYTLCGVPDRGFLTSLPEIFAKLVIKYPPPSAAIM